MLYRLPFLWLVIAFSLPQTRELAAQTPSPLSAEASVGIRVGHGGTYTDRGGAALDLVFGYRLGDISAGTLLVGAFVELQSPVTMELEAEFPTFFSGGALLGVQRGSAETASVRIMGGPVYYHAQEDGARALGVQGRLDAATPSWMHAAVVASLRQSVLPSFRGEAVGITSVGLGLRIQ